MKQPIEVTKPLSQKTIYARTTLGERIHSLTNGAELIPITVLPRLLPLSYQTIKNQISLGTFLLSVIRIGRRNFVRTEDVARLIEGSIETKTSIQKKCGRKSNREKSVEAQKDGNTA